MSDFQFYPTPVELAEKAWSLFRDQDFERVLEPSAGNGDLLVPILSERYASRGISQYRCKVDVLEIDATKHPLLKKNGARIVGHDFLGFTGVGRYSHVIMNPPFAYGAQHLLHAWKHLYSGEIVCILNAETLTNAFSRERTELLHLIDQFGRAEFVGSAFSQAERQTDVDVVLVHLVKEAQADALVGDLLGSMSADHSKHDESLDFGFSQQLALPKGVVEDSVLRFDAAVAAAKESANARAKAAFYSRGLGKTFAQMHAQEKVETARDMADSPKMARSLFAADYDELKDRAWMSILRSTEVLSKLSSKVQKGLEAEFETIKGMEFTTQNVYGFLQGLCEASTDMQVQMMLDVFDEISRYHEDNSVFFMGWKSNGKHRTAGMRLKTTRFILPGHRDEGWRTSIGFESERLLADFDKVFAMLDGKREDQIWGLSMTFRNPETLERLKQGSRERSDYFEVRYYPKRGTIHFFPRSKELMDRLNRLVGVRRQWLPPDPSQANADFHAQHEQAERYDAELRKAFADARRGTRNASWALSQVVRMAQHADDTEEMDTDDESSLMAMDTALSSVMKAHGWNPSTALESSPEPQRLLLEA